MPQNIFTQHRIYQQNKKDTEFKDIEGNTLTSCHFNSIILAGLKSIAILH